MKTMNQILANLNENQKQLLADTIVFAGWGTADFITSEGEHVNAYGYIPDNAYKGGHFERKSLSSKFKSLYKSLGLVGTNHDKLSEDMGWVYDWWENGTGSILLIRDGLYQEMEKWARDYNHVKRELGYDDLLHAIATFNADPYAVDGDEDLANEILNEILKHGANEISNDIDLKLAASRLDIKNVKDFRIFRAGRCTFAIEE